MYKTIQVMANKKNHDFIIERRAQSDERGILKRKSFEIVLHESKVLH